MATTPVNYKYNKTINYKNSKIRVSYTAENFVRWDDYKGVGAKPGTEDVHCSYDLVMYGIHLGEVNWHPLNSPYTPAGKHIEFNGCWFENEKRMVEYAYNVYNSK